ncbi:acyl-CoA dehydrogenase family protein [Rhodococcus sp. T7]|uniref:acyl-CoA dehydrogenase family protein n=1 Tax=Rhodococcus sp. T7 TaxID=627444 RepID=UPI001F3D6A7E|nr:acyl-CoA dehydrogenase family protein [Rhodococcus sp. T7]
MADHAAADVDIETSRKFLSLLHQAGLVGITWPVEFGGQGRGESDENVFAVESARYNLPLKVFRLGLGTVGPAILELGTVEQKTSFCRDILTGDAIWCQLFSEPEAGSDLAGIRTSATRVDGGYVVRGQKVWTSGAHLADRALLLARTDPDVPKHAGLTMFLIDMHQPEITVRPLPDVSGRAFFNEVLIDGAFVPESMTLGEVGAGWAAAGRTLQHERAAVSTGLGKGDRDTDTISVKNLLNLARTHGRFLGDTARADLLDLLVADRLVGHLRLRLTQEAEAGTAIGARGSIVKLLMGRNEIEAAKTASRVLGPLAVTGRDPGGSPTDVMQTVIGSPGLAIAGGTEEIQKNIVAERILGLPREPDPLRQRPFRELRVTGDNTSALGVQE